MEFGRCSVARGSKSCNKVAVGEPAAGSLLKLARSLASQPMGDGAEDSPAPQSRDDWAVQRCDVHRILMGSDHPTCCSGCLGPCDVEERSSLQYGFRATGLWPINAMEPLMAMVQPDPLKKKEPRAQRASKHKLDLALFELPLELKGKNK